MKKSTKILMRSVVAVLVLIVIAAGYLGINEIRGVAPSFSALSIQSRLDKAIVAIADEDTAIACNKLGFSESELRYADALSAIKENGITILSGKTDLMSIRSADNGVTGEANIQIQSEKNSYWASENGNWTFVEVSDKTYDVRFSFYVINNKILFGNAVSVYDSSDAESKLESPPAYINTLMELLRGCDSESLYAKELFTTTLETPTTCDAFINRINNGFNAIVNGKVDDACDFFGFHKYMSKECFGQAIGYIEATELTILSATVDESSVAINPGITSGIVTMNVRQDEAANTFGYMAEWPIGIYSMKFVMNMQDGAITIGKLIEIYLPGESDNSLKVYYNTETGDVVYYDTPAAFMPHLYQLLQSYDLNSECAKFWGY